MDQLVLSLAGEPIQLEFLIVDGLPPEEIVKRTPDFDLVVLSRPRVKPVWRLFSKKTAQRVMDRARCEVLVV
jgi:nucleotide-binding universal stress UspA family protein